MRLLDIFKRRQKTANVARDRLQILVAHERLQRNAPSYLPQLKIDILEVIKKYVDVEPDAISVSIGQEDQCEVLELNIALPDKK
jgi:cell division topological specificity factor